MLICEKCGQKFEYLSEDTKFTCPYCGTTNNDDSKQSTPAAHPKCRTEVKKAKQEKEIHVIEEETATAETKSTELKFEPESAEQKKRRRIRVKLMCWSAGIFGAGGIALLTVLTEKTPLFTTAVSILSVIALIVFAFSLLMD